MPRIPVIAFHARCVARKCSSSTTRIPLMGYSIGAREGQNVRAESRIFTAFFLAFALWCALPAPAQDTDPPGRVARLGFMSGSVSFEPAGENDWSLASLNYPLTGGDRLWTDKDARAELDTGNLAIRMSEQTDLTTTTLNDQMVQLGLGQGTVRISAYELRPGNEIEVDTPFAAITITQAGNYRIETYPDQNRTLIAVSRGEVQVTGNNLNQTVRSGQAVELSGTEPVQVSSISLPPADSFDQWCNQRDQPFLNARSRQYVSPYVPGFHDLDQYGGWETVAAYGPIWYPVGLPVGWYPYRFGRWVWVEPWGWTWVDAAPWGVRSFSFWTLAAGRHAVGLDTRADCRSAYLWSGVRGVRRRSGIFCELRRRRRGGLVSARSRRAVLSLVSPQRCLSAPD